MATVTISIDYERLLNSLCNRMTGEGRYPVTFSIYIENTTVKADILHEEDKVMGIVRNFETVEEAQSPQTRQQVLGELLHMAFQWAVRSAKTSYL